MSIMRCISWPSAGQKSVDLPPEELLSQDDLDEMVDIIIEYHWHIK